MATSGAFWPYEELIRDIEQHFKGTNVMLVIDCCFAGSIQQALRTLAPLRCIYLAMASQQADQIARGHWTVTMAINSVLHGAAVADKDQDGSISVAEIVSFTADAVAMVKQDRMSVTLHGPLDTSQKFLNCDLNGQPVLTEKGVWAPLSSWCGIRSSGTRPSDPTSVKLRHGDAVWLSGGVWEGNERCIVMEDEGSKILFQSEDGNTHIESKTLITKCKFKGNELAVGSVAFAKWEGATANNQGDLASSWVLPNWYPCVVKALNGQAGVTVELKFPPDIVADPVVLDATMGHLLPADYFRPSKEAEEIVAFEECLQALSQAGVSLGQQFQPGTRVVVAAAPRWSGDPEREHRGVVCSLETGKLTRTALAQLCNSTRNRRLHDSEHESLCVSWDDEYQYSIVSVHLIEDATHWTRAAPTVQELTEERKASLWGMFCRQTRQEQQATWQGLTDIEREFLHNAVNLFNKTQQATQQSAAQNDAPYASIVFKKGDIIWLKGGPWTTADKPDGWRGVVQADAGQKVVFVCEDGQLYRESKSRVCRHQTGGRQGVHDPKVDDIVSMGFSREQAAYALEAAGGNHEMAVAMLLG